MMGPADRIAKLSQLGGSILIVQYLAFPLDYIVTLQLDHWNSIDLYSG